MLKTTKRMLSLLLALVMVITLMPVSRAHAEDAKTYQADETAATELGLVNVGDCAMFVIVSAVTPSREMIANAGTLSNGYKGLELATRSDANNVAANAVWTITKVDGGYTVSNGQRNVAIKGNHQATLEADAVVQIKKGNNGTDDWVIYANVGGTDYCLNDHDSFAEAFSHGSAMSTFTNLVGGRSMLKLYKVTEGTASPDPVDPPEEVVLTVDAGNTLRVIDSDSIFGINHRYAFNGYGSFDSENMKIKDDFRELYEAAGFGSIRYPGGTISNLFNWKTTIGPVEQRKDQIHGFYNNAGQGGIAPNFGLAEIGTFAQSVGSEIVYVYSLGRGNAQDAADLIEYLNAKVGTNPNGGIDWAAVRAADGHPDPYNVRYFEIGNEMQQAWAGSDGTASQGYWTTAVNGGSEAAYIDGGTAVFTKQYAVCEEDWNAVASRSDGSPNQVRYMRYANVNPMMDDGEGNLVNNPDFKAVNDGVTVFVGDTQWTVVDSFANSGAGDRHVVIDYSTGAIHFGDGVHGAIPANGQQILVSYSVEREGFIDVSRAMKETTDAINQAEGTHHEAHIYSSYESHGFINKMAERNANDLYDGLTIHPYSGTPSGSGAEFYDSAMSLAENVGVRKVQEYVNMMPEDKVPVISEYGIFRSTDPLVRSQTHAVYIAKVLMEYVRLGSPYIQKHCLIDWYSSGADSLGPTQQAVIQAVAGSDADTKTGEGTFTFFSTPSAHVFQMLNAGFGDRVVSTEFGSVPTMRNGAKALSALASKANDGTVYVAIVNAGREEDYNLVLNLENINLDGAVVTAQVLTADTFDAQNSPQDPENVSVMTQNVSFNADEFIYTVPKHTFVVLKIDPVDAGVQYQDVALEIGETVTITDTTGYYVGMDTSDLDTDVATVTLSGTMAGVVLNLSDPVTAFAGGKEYAIQNTRSGMWLGNKASSNNRLVQTGKADVTMWNITPTQGGFYIQDPSGKYLTLAAATASLSDRPVVVAVTASPNTAGAWQIGYDGQYLNDHNQTDAGGWSTDGDAGSQWMIYEASVEQVATKTDITFTGVGAGTTSVQIGDTVYNITVEGVCDHSKNTNDYTDNGDGTHSLICSVCDAVLETASHQVRDCVCTICGAEQHNQEYLEHGDCECYDCGQEIHSPDENCVCTVCGKSAHVIDPATGICGECNTLGAVATVTQGENVVYYPTLNDAIAAAQPMDGSLITLVNTADEHAEFDSGRMTLDLNGQTITGGGWNTAMAIEGSIDLTIVDSGEEPGLVAASDYSIFVTGESSNVTITDGRFQGCIMQTVSGTITITGGTFTNNGWRIFDKWSDSVTGIIVLKGGEFPEGLKVGSNAGYANDLLAEGYGYYNDKGEQISVADDAREIEGYVRVIQIHDHTGGEATCENGKICDVCGAEYTKALGHIDTDPVDHKCDRCETVLSECEDKNNDHKCDICGAVLSECADKDPADHKCDICGETLSECKDDDNNHKCDICGATLSECADKDPADHKCDICGETLSDCIDENKDYKCDICGAELEKPAPEKDEIIRLAGSHRWNTAIKVADEMKTNLGVEKFDAIIIASGNDFADALAGSYLSTVKNAPILLAWGQGGAFEFLDTDNINYIKANLAEDGIVYILGGEKAVPGLYEEALKDFTVKRLGGADRFETNLLILEEAGIDDGSEILVCTATNFADSLSASATGKPILLVFNNLTELIGKQPEFLAGLKDCTFTVIGGENAVSDKLAEAIGEYGKVERLAGDNRFETSVLVAQKYFENPETAVLAYALNYPDGLCGGSLAFSLKAPLILTMTGYEAAAVEYAKTTGIKTGLVLGGDALISDASVRTIFAMDAADEIVVK